MRGSKGNHEVNRVVNFIAMSYFREALGRGCKPFAVSIDRSSVPTGLSTRVFRYGGVFSYKYDPEKQWELQFRVSRNKID